MIAGARLRGGLDAILFVLTLLLMLCGAALSGEAACTSGSISGGSGFTGFGNGAFYILPSGGSGTLNLTFNGAGCTWSVTAQSWLTFSPASGTSTGTSQTVSITAAANGTASERGSLISLTVNGAAAGSVNAYQNPPSCALSTSPSSIAVGMAGGTGSFTMVTNPAGCWYSLPSGTPSWVTLGDPGSGYTYTYSVAANTGPPRSGTITWSIPSTATVTFNQAGVLSVSCSPTTGPTQVGTAYSATCTASGGTAPYTWSLSAGALPSGITMGTTGTSIGISGTPKSAGSYSYTIKVTDSSSPVQSATQGYVGTITSPVTLSCTPTTGPTEVGVAYSATCTPSGGALYAFSISAGALPAGVTLTGNSISGTPTTAGSYSYTVRVDSMTPAAFATQTYSGVVQPAVAISCTPKTGPVQVGVGYSATCTASGGTAPYVWSVASGALPSGITLGSSTGSISGSPTAPGSYTYAIKVTDANTGIASQSYSGTVTSPAPTLTMSCTPATGPTQVGTAYSATCTASGGTPAYTWSVSSGALPAGITLSATTGTSITVSGTPTVPGAYTYSIKVGDSGSPTPQSASQSYSGTVTSPAPTLTMSCTPATGPTQVGTAYSATCTASGGTAPYNWSVGSGAPPAGVTLSATTGTSITVSGTPTVPGAYAYSIKVVDTGTLTPQSAAQNYSGTVTSPAPTLTMSCTPVAGPAQVGTAYSATCTASGGTPSYNWSVGSGVLPAGITMSGTTGTSITVSGTPTSPGPYAYSIKVVDSGSPTPQSASQSYSGISGTAVPTLTMSCTPVTGPTQVGTAYSATCTASGGTPAYGWSVGSGALPAGVTLSATTGTSITVSGTPTVPGAYAYSIKVVDTGTPTPQSASQSYSGTVAPPSTLSVTPGNLTFTFVTGQATPPTQNVTVTSSGAVLTFSVSATTTTGGSWLSAGVTGAQTPATIPISVAPAGLAAGSYTGQVKVSPASGSAVSVTVTLNVLSPVTVNCTPATGPAKTGVSYSTLCTASGGTAPYSWAITAGSLPSGLALIPSNGSASINGTPSAAGAYSYSVSVADSGTPSQAASQAFSGTIVAAGSVSGAPSSLTFTYRKGDPNPSPQGVPLSSSNGPTAFSASATTTSGGNWLSVTPASGQTPVTLSVAVNPAALDAGTYSGQLTISTPNASPSSLTVPVTLTVQGVLTMTCTRLDGPAIVGSNYTATCTASGGTAPYKWAIATGTLPGGIALTAAGATATISGAATATGGYSYAVAVTDSSSPAQSASQQYTGTVNAASTPATLTVAPASLNFSYRADDAAAPVPQTLSVFCTVTGTAFTVSATTASGGSWLSVSPASGKTPASVTVAVNVASLTPGTYTGQIAVNAPSASPASVTVPVSLTITAVPPGLLTVLPPALTASTVQGGATMVQQIVVSNAGGGTLNFGATASTASWLALNTVSGRASAGSAALIGVTLNPQGLSAGTYHAQVVLRTTDGSQSTTVPITLTVNGLTQSIVLTQTGLQFTAISGGSPPPPQNFTILNGGLGAMSWTATPQALSGGNWLSASPASGSAIAGSTGEAPVAVAVDPKSLAPGVYYGVVRAAATGAGNSPQVVSVSFNVLAPGDVPAPTVSPVGLLPVGVAGGANATDTTTLFNVANVAQAFTSTVSTQDGGNWLSVNPAAGTVPAAGSTQLTVQVNASGLSAGVRYGTVRLAFPGGTVRTLSVVSVLGPGGGSAPERRAAGATANCSPSFLVLTLQSLEAAFAVTASEAAPLTAKIVDNCGTAVMDGATVSVSFSSKDPTLTMVAGNGTWNSTWTPRSAGVNIDVLITAFQVRGQNVLAGQLKVTGTVRNAANTAAASPQLITNSASYQGAGQISPGSWVSIFGERLADKTGLADVVPFPSALNGTQVLLGEVALPVQYVSAGQVNALIPYSLSASANHPLLVQRSGTASVPLDVTVADVLPAIYSANQSGSGQGAILIANTGVLAAPAGAYSGSRPVRRGEFLEIYASGLGPVANTPADGAAAPVGATLIATPSVTIGGVPVTKISYAGLAPGLVGLYQLNMQVPDGAPIGDAVEVVVTVGGNASNTVTIAVAGGG